MTKYFNKLKKKNNLKPTDHQHQYILRKIHETPEVCRAFLLFYALTGCDKTGGFRGLSKRLCWDIFMKLSNEVLKQINKSGFTR